MCVYVCVCVCVCVYVGHVLRQYMCLVCVHITCIFTHSDTHAQTHTHTHTHTHTNTHKHTHTHTLQLVVADEQRAETSQAALDAVQYQVAFRV